MSDLIDKQISPPIQLYCGETWQIVVNLTPSSGSPTVSAVSHQLMLKDQTDDLASTYVTGSPSYSGLQVTTGQVGKVSSTTILPGAYTYFLFVTTSAGIICFTQQLEFLAVTGL